MEWELLVESGALKRQGEGTECSGEEGEDLCCWRRRDEDVVDDVDEAVDGMDVGARDVRVEVDCGAAEREGEGGEAEALGVVG